MAHDPPTGGNSSTADSTIALAVVRSLRTVLGAAAHGIAIDVQDGCVSLRGQVDWDHQRHDAVLRVASLPEVRKVDDHLSLRVRGAEPELASSIQHVLVGLALADARHIDVSVEGSVVTLRGRVHSTQQREAAVRAVAEAPGVSEVIDRLEVDLG